MIGRDLMILFTVDPRKDPERAAMGLSIATAARMSDSQVDIFFALDGVYAAVKDCMKGIVVPEFAPMEEIMAILLEEGVKMHVCHPFLGPRNLRMEDLREGIALTSAVGLVQHGTNASILTI
jgi:predicted peroxiredoxin